MTNHNEQDVERVAKAHPNYSVGTGGRRCEGCNEEIASFEGSVSDGWNQHLIRAALDAMGLPSRDDIIRELECAAYEDWDIDYTADAILGLYKSRRNESLELIHTPAPREASTVTAEQVGIIAGWMSVSLDEHPERVLEALTGALRDLHVNVQAGGE